MDATDLKIPVIQLLQNQIHTFAFIYLHFHFRIKQKMNDSHSKKKKSNDKEKVQNARKQVIKCEAIIRKVLAIQECFMELNTFSENCIY